MQPTEQVIFVIDAADEADFAFEAWSLVQAEEFARTPWFLWAIGSFCLLHGTDCDGCLPLRPRRASDAEAAIFRNVSDEFADVLGCFLVVHLGSCPECHLIHMRG